MLGPAVSGAVTPGRVVRRSRQVPARTGHCRICSGKASGVTQDEGAVPTITFETDDWCRTAGSPDNESATGRRDDQATACGKATLRRVTVQATLVHKRMGVSSAGGKRSWLSFDTATRGDSTYRLKPPQSSPGMHRSDIRRCARDQLRFFRRSNKLERQRACDFPGAVTIHQADLAAAPHRTARKLSRGVSTRAYLRDRDRVGLRPPSSTRPGRQTRRRRQRMEINL